MQTSNDYTSRLYDLFVFNGADPSSDAALKLDIGLGQAVTSGIQKICQKYIVALLTEKGSVKSDPSYGTFFISNIKISSGLDNNKVQTLFSDASNDAISWLATYDTPTNDDEIIKNVSLLDVAVTYDKIRLKINLITQLDESLTLYYLIPKTTL